MIQERRSTKRLWAFALLALTACGGGAPVAGSESAASEPAAGRVALSADADTIYHRTLVRDRALGCAELTEGIASPVAALLEITDRVTAPPSSGIRAAECLLEGHALEVEPQLTAWVSHRETMGFGLLVLAHLDTLEPALGERLARAALAGELSDRARPVISRSSRHAILAGPSAGPGATEPSGAGR